MTATGDGEHGIDTAIAELYRRPLDEFVSRREALAKELRGSGDRESAAVVKALRKPSLAAWALNLVTLEEPEAMSALLEGIRDAVAAQSSGGGAAEAISGLRTAVRDFAVEASRAAQTAGHEVDINVLAGALFAVLGKTERFDDLRRGWLTEIPEAGGLDLLALVPALPADSSPPTPRPPHEKPAERAPRDGDADRVTARARAEDGEQAARARAKEAARARAAEAEKALASAKEHAETAVARLEEAEAILTSAEARLRKAEDEVAQARDRRDKAQREAAAAEQGVERAEADAAEAERQLTGP